MASITPLSALPANGVTPSGTLTLSNLQGRLTVKLTNGGAAQLLLITMTEGGNWAYVPGAVLNVSDQENLGDGVGVLDFTNASTTTKYHVVKPIGSAALSAWLSALTGPGTSTALVAHASSHLSGGSDDLLGAPGNVGDVTPGVFCGTFGPDGTHQNTVPSVNGGTFCLIASAQTLTNKTLTTPIINGLTSASGNADFSGSTGTFKTSTGAVTIGGGAAAITATSSAAAITLTAGAASTWSTTAGALNLDGFAGINLKINGATVADVGATAAGSLTMAANKSLDFAAGTGGISAGSATGDGTLPTGALTWAGAASKAGSIKAGTSAALTLGGNGASVASFDAAGLGFLMASGKVVGFGAPQALSGAGAVNVTTFATLFTSTGAAQALTLADGVMAGQVKFVMHIVDGGSGVLTPTTPTGFATITFTNVRDWAALIWTGAAWAPLAYSGATFA